MNPPAAALICPKCTSEMRSYERNGVTIDQCTACKGVFLDRGELDRLIDAEGNYYDRERAPAPMAARPDQHRGDQYRDDDRHRRDEHRYRGRKKHGFLGDLFD